MANDLPAPAATLPAVVGPTEILAAITDMARNPDIDPGKISALIELHRSLQADQAKRAFDDAFMRLSIRLPRITKKGEVKYPVDKDRPNGTMKKAFNYARYEDIFEIIGPMLKDEGFWFAFDTVPQTDGRVIVSGELIHSAGHKKSTQFGPLPLDTSGGKNNIQAVESTYSYGKRVCVTALLNLIFEGVDDNGVAGGTILIDAASVKQLSDMIMIGSLNLDGFLKFMQVETLADIQVVDFQKGVNALLSRMSPEAVEKWRATLPKSKEKR